MLGLTLRAIRGCDLDTIRLMISVAPAMLGNTFRGKYGCTGRLDPVDVLVGQIGARHRFQRHFRMLMRRRVTLGMIGARHRFPGLRWMHS